MRILSPKLFAALTIIAIACVMSVSADDVTAKGHNSLVLSFDANTGTLMDDTYVGGRLKDNVFDYGVEGAHKFGIATWLTFYAKLTLQSSIKINYLNIRETYPVPGENFNVYPKYLINGVDSFSLGFNYVEAGVRFSPVFKIISDKFSIGLNAFIAVRHNLMLRSEIACSFNIPFGIFIKPFAGIDAYPFFRGSKWTTPPGDKELKNPGGAGDTSINDLYGGLQIGMGFAWLGIKHLDAFSFSVDASWRTNGAKAGVGTMGGATGLWKVDEADAFLYNGFLRANFTLNYAATSRLSTYLQIRYQLKNIIPLPQGTATRIDRPSHDVYLRAGVSYRFDGAKK